MATKLDKKIVGFQVLKEDTVAPTPEAPKPDVMHEGISRPEMLFGSTYKVHTPVSDHSMYITINDIVLNQDTEHETHHPYEIFINSKSQEHSQWAIALTRVISAIFRKGGDITFMVEELLSVYDPNGGYYKKGGVYMPSLVAEIGAVIERHMKAIGMIQTEELNDTAKAILAEKRAAYEAQQDGASTQGDYPAGSTLCNKCNTKAVIIMDGCKTCLNCGDSKCG